MKHPWPILQTDRKFSEYFQAHENRWLKKLFKAFSHLGAGALWISIYGLGFLFLGDRFHELILTLIFAELTGLIIIIILRYRIRRKRPSADYRCFFLTPWNKYSFPSHHAFRAFLIAIIVETKYPGLFPWLMITAAIIGFSRIYLSKHYLSDVLAGMLLALVVASVWRMPPV